MASEKKPSIYSDRGNIGSAEELDEYGVWVKGEPQDLLASGADYKESDDFSLSGFDSGFEELTPEDASETDFSGTDDSTAFDAFALPDADLTENDFNADSADDPAAVSAEENYDAGFEEFSVPDEDEGDAMPPVSEEDSFIEVSSEEESFETVQEDFSAPVRESVIEKTETVPQAGQHDLSTQLLMKIAEELSSIRSELSSLKKEFSIIRTETPVEQKEEQRGGFFAEEDDETISLTGDELNNIIKTADFTEEAGANEKLESEFTFSEDLESSSVSAGDESLAEDTAAEISLDDDISADMTDIDTSTLDAITLETGMETPIALDDTESLGIDVLADDFAEPGASDENETAVTEESGDEELIDIDLDDLGISLESDVLLDEESSAQAEEATAEENLLAEDIEISDMDITEENLLAEDIEISDMDITEESFSAEENFDAELTEIDLDETKDSEELKQLRTDGALPMTPAPEDSTYLEDAAIKESSEEDFSVDISFEDDSSFDTTSLDLSEAVIDEPDLSAGIVENPVIEPTLEEIDDVSFDIDALDGLTDAGSEEETDIPVSLETDLDDLDDFDAGLSGEDDSIVQVIPEGFEAGIEEAPVSLDEDLDIDISAESAKDEDTVLEANESRDTGLHISNDDSNIPTTIKSELINVLSYLDQLLESLPEEKIEEFAKSEYFDAYKKLFKELGLV